MMLPASFQRAFLSWKEQRVFPSYWRLLTEAAPPTPSNCQWCEWEVKRVVELGRELVVCYGCGCVWDGERHE